MATRIAIWAVEHEVGDGLPPERVYAPSGAGDPLGAVVLPDSMAATTYEQHVRLKDVASSAPAYLASVTYRELVSVAIRGEFGLSWEPTP